MPASPAPTGQDTDGHRDALNPGIDEDLGADNTGLMRAVQRRAFGGHAVYSRLDDGILFGVDAAAKFVVLTAGDMELLPKASHFLTMGDALWRSIVARGKDLPVLDQNGTYLSAQTGGALRYRLGNVQIIVFLYDPFHGALLRKL